MPPFKSNKRSCQQKKLFISVYLTNSLAFVNLLFIDRVFLHS